ncbi:unnamed protein product, partial [Ascophyllum nodosum]
GKAGLRRERICDVQDPPDRHRRLLRSRTEWRGPRDTSEVRRTFLNTFLVTPFFSGCCSKYCRKWWTLAPSLEMTMELIRIRTAQQYLILMAILFLSNLATRERPYDSLLTLWTVFANLKHN